MSDPSRTGPIRIGLTRDGAVVPLSSRTHAENVWAVREEFGPYVAIGMAPTSGQLLGRKNAINLAVWLLRAAGASRVEVDNAMVEALGAEMAQGFRAQFGDDEP